MCIYFNTRLLNFKKSLSVYLLKSSHNLGNTDERAQGSELRSPAGEESVVGMRDLFSRLLPCRVLLSWPGPPSKSQLLAGIPCIYHSYQGLVPVPFLLLEVPECLGRLTLYLCLFLKPSSHCWKLSSVQFSRPVMSDSLWPHGLQHTRPPCPSPTPGIYSNSCPLSWWCHPTISSFIVPFSSSIACSV